MFSLIEGGIMVCRCLVELEWGDNLWTLDVLIIVCHFVVGDSCGTEWGV